MSGVLADPTYVPFNLKNLNPGDTKSEIEAVVKYVNEHGGVAGRKLSVVWYKASVYQS